MSRRRALECMDWDRLRRQLRENRVHLLSAGLDEAPGVYKDIAAVMADQADVVEVLGRFDPRIVKMAPSGERAED